MTPSTLAKSTDVLKYAKTMQKKLNLLHWRIEVSATAAEQGTYFQIVTNRPRNHASIRVSEAGLAHPDWERFVKHEMIHLIVDPIREEHDFQLEALQTERRQEYSSRHLREIEKVVEHLSYIL